MKLPLIFVCMKSMSLKINQLAKCKNHRTSLRTRKLTPLDIKREQTNFSRSTAVVGTPGCRLPRVLWSRHLLHHKQVQASKVVHFRKCCWISKIIFDLKEQRYGRRWAHVADPSRWGQKVEPQDWICAQGRTLFADALLHFPACCRWKCVNKIIDEYH